MKNLDLSQYSVRTDLAIEAHEIKVQEKESHIGKEKECFAD